MKRAHNQMIRVHYGMKRVLNQIILRCSRIVRAQNQIYKCITHEKKT